MENNYISKGEGFPLILLHGNGEDLSYFKNQTPEFSKYFKVYAIDTRAHGKSERGEGALSIKRFSEDLFDFFAWQKIDRAHILGFSDGANIAMYFALAHPDKVDKLILNGGNLNPKGVKARYQCPIEIGYKIASHFAGKSQKAKENAELLSLMVNEPDIKPEELKKITSPTLVIAGKKDMIKEKHTRLIAKSLPHSELRIINGDHFIAAKNSEKFNKIVLDFLTK